MALPEIKQIDRIIQSLKERQTDEVSLADMVALVDAAARSLRTFFEAMDDELLRELNEIGEYIGRLRREIGALQPNDMSQVRIPAAGHELDRIVKATEHATNFIMERAEAVLGADASDPERYKSLVDEQMLRIIEACSFQDLTGQRIAKVVHALKQIEARVGRFAEATRIDDVDNFALDEEAAAAKRRMAWLSRREAAAERKPADNRPIAPPVKGFLQEDIDRLF